MKIAFLGNCQRSGIVHCMKAMHPALEFKEIDAASIVDGTADLESSLKDCNRIVSQTDWWATQFLEPIVTQYQYDVVYCPRINFAAFHPDLTYVQNRGTFVQSPLSDYNSKIVLFGYLRGLSVGDTLRLFNANVYEALGYFNFWAPAKDELFRELNQAGFPTDELLHVFDQSSQALRVVRDRANSA
jgi:hypothetical protein